MKSFKQTNLYTQVLKEFNYSFGDVFILNNIVISEIKSDIVFTWDNHAKLIIKDVCDYLDSDGSNLIYISNRINSYNVMPTDWLKFFKNNNALKEYYVVGVEKSSFINAAFENLFFNSKIKKFTKIEAAIETALQSQIEVLTA
ncbi:MAG: hypothetical protein AB8B52_09725 [Winogradskyella sp.]|uniref:hypothetical protein n=1 Tax=Winogradskyella sp. TaxID=1883156 RepID=UPI00385B4580